MRYWDTSGIVALLVDEAKSSSVASVHEADIEIATWWGTPVECLSALARRERDAELDPAEMRDALSRLRELSAAWTAVVPTESLRRSASRLLRVHPLRAADALQLAAAATMSDADPSRQSFVTLDNRLAAAAEREGFEVIQPG